MTITLPAGWKPIESAPKNQLVMVYTPPQPSDWPDSVRIGFDYIDTEIADDYWYNHGEHYEHYCCVAKPENCTGPQERAPYTHWMPLPAAPGTTPASAQPSRDWELDCDHCNGSGHVFVKHQVAERESDVQEFKEDCECCEGRGFVFAFQDIPGIEKYVKACRPAPAAGDARDAERWRSFRNAITQQDLGWLDRMDTALTAMGCDLDDETPPSADQVDAAADAAMAASQQQEG